MYKWINSVRPLLIGSRILSRWGFSSAFFSYASFVVLPLRSRLSRLGPLMKLLLSIEAGSLLVQREREREASREYRHQKSGQTSSTIYTPYINRIYHRIYILQPQGCLSFASQKAWKNFISPIRDLSSPRERRGGVDLHGLEGFLFCSGQP